jgi:translation initiation factor 3 subunit I
MKVHMLKGHDRAITSITLNHDGDLLFSTSKGSTITLWYTCDGVRLGTYHGHKGTVWCVDPSRDSKRLLSAGADNMVKLWELETGRELYSWDRNIPMRWVQHAEGEKMFLAVTDNVLGKKPSILIHKLDRDVEKCMCFFFFFFFSCSRCCFVACDNHFELGFPGSVVFFFSFDLLQWKHSR